MHIVWLTGKIEDGIAPGMAVSFDVVFKPHHLGNYEEHLEIIPEVLNWFLIAFNKI